MLHKGPLANCPGCANNGRMCMTCNQPYTLSTALYHPNTFCSLTCEGSYTKADTMLADVATINQFNADYGNFVGKVTLREVKVGRKP